MCDHSAWAPLLPHWGAAHTILTADYGMADTTVNMAETALNQAKARFGDAPFAVLGHSMGGRVALELMRKPASRSVTHLALMGTGFAPVAAGEAGEQEISGRMGHLHTAQTLGVLAMAANWATGMVAPHRLMDMALMGTIFTMFARKSPAVLAAQQQALIQRQDGSSVLKSLRIPTLFLTGRMDGWANVAQHQAMLDLCAPHNPKASLAVIESSGHMVMMEAPAETARVLAGFLGMAFVAY